MVNNILLVDDEPLFHSIMEDACSLLNICLNLVSASNVAEAETMFKSWQKGEEKKPEVVFVNTRLKGSSYDGIELIRKLNKEYGNGVVVGVIASYVDQSDMDKAQNVGAQFWIVRSQEIEATLEQFSRDLDGYKAHTKAFRVYS